MGFGYYILIADGFGGGLVLINPRLYTAGKDGYGNPKNWWPRDESTTEEDIAKKHGLDEKYKFYKVLF